MIFGIDVDLVIVPSDRAWIEWLQKISDKFPNFSNAKRYVPKDCEKLPYDSSLLFPNFKEETGVDPFSFWDEPYLYDKLKPFPLAIVLIKRLIDLGHDVIFISHTKGDHMSSKVRMLKRYFPFVPFDSTSNSGYIATKEKHLVKVDVMLDDRAINLNRFNDEVIKIYVDTDWYDPDFDESNVDHVADKNFTWYSIYDFLGTIIDEL